MPQKQPIQPPPVKKNLYAREKSSGYRGYHKTLHLQPHEYK